MHQATFDYSTLKAYISKTENNRNKWISDSNSWHLKGYNVWRKGSKCTNNIHAQNDAQKHCFIYPRTTLRREIGLQSFRRGYDLSLKYDILVAIMIATNYFVLIVVSRPIYIYIF